MQTRVGKKNTTQRLIIPELPINGRSGIKILGWTLLLRMLSSPVRGSWLGRQGRSGRKACVALSLQGQHSWRKLRLGHLTQVHKREAHVCVLQLTLHLSSQPSPAISQSHRGHYGRNRDQAGGVLSMSCLGFPRPPCLRQIRRGGSGPEQPTASHEKGVYQQKTRANRC